MNEYQPEIDVKVGYLPYERKKADSHHLAGKSRFLKL